MSRFLFWISLLCAGVILFVGSGFIAPVLSGLVLAFGLRPLEDSFVFKKIASRRVRTFTLLFLFMSVFGTLSTYVIIASAKGIVRNVDLKSLQRERNPDSSSANSTSENEEADGLPVQSTDELFGPYSEEDVEPPSGVLSKVQGFLEKIPGLSTVEIAKMGSELISRAQSLALLVLSKILTAGPTIFIQWIVFLITFVVFFLSYDQVLGFLHSFEKKHKGVSECIVFFQNAAQATLMGTLVVGSAQATIIAVGTAIAGFNSFILLGLCAFFASFVPFFGTGLVWVSALAYTLIHGDTQAAIIVGVSGAMSSVADNLILPTFIGSKNKVHPLLLFIVVIGFIEWIGIWGLFIGPVLSIFSTRVFELWYKTTLKA
ncbi:MAG: AI-2E family transporter [Bdellovibrionota bacterium]